ncbi:hypothetical protein ES319_A07G219000v1 [Gossypium barbadense]|uniref:Uncharacterized protein n=2 Tax=Gossypium TaxID=3633 RepID=A0A5J5V6R9_GOSBA|nr:hypothetical protein ES319_A07G219000v1 [Gossypium barbadense]TYH11178.1 hypothetical protein ES288_A07G237300v1 [Gossypium darwinii]
MASSPMVHYMSSVSPHSPKCYHNNQTLALPHSNFLSPTSFLRLKRKTLFSNIQFNKPLAPRPLVYALQSNFFKVIQTVWKVGKDGVEAGTNLVPVKVQSFCSCDSSVRIKDIVEYTCPYIFELGTLSRDQSQGSLFQLSLCL